MSSFLMSFSRSLGVFLALAFFVLTVESFAKAPGGFAPKCQPPVNGACSGQQEFCPVLSVCVPNAAANCVCFP